MSSREMKDKIVEEQLADFARKLIESQQPLEPEFAKVLNENMWELLA